MKDQIIKVTVSYMAFFESNPSEGRWKGLPDDMRDLFQNNEGSLRGITENLIQDEHYTVTIIINKT